MAVEDSVPSSRDLYQRLGIAKTAPLDEIKRNYRKLAMKWHPDKNPDNRDKATENFRLISQAYECLSDEKKRRDYDRYGIIPGETRSVPTGDGSARAHDRVFGFDSFGPMGADPFFTFDRAQRIFESFFGTRDPFSLFDDDTFGGPVMLPSMFSAQRSLFSDFMSDDLFDDTRAGRSHGGFQSSFISSGSFGGGGESVSKQITIVNGKKTTRTEKTTIGADGVARCTVTEEVEDLSVPGSRASSERRPIGMGDRHRREENSKGTTKPPALMKLISPLPSSSTHPESSSKSARVVGNVSNQSFTVTARTTRQHPPSAKVPTVLAPKQQQQQSVSNRSGVLPVDPYSKPSKFRSPEHTVSHSETPHYVDRFRGSESRSATHTTPSKMKAQHNYDYHRYCHQPPLADAPSPSSNACAAPRVPIVSTLADMKLPPLNIRRSPVDIPRPTPQSPLLASQSHVDHPITNQRSPGRTQGIVAAPAQQTSLQPPSSAGHTLQSTHLPIPLISPMMPSPLAPLKAQASPNKHTGKTHHFSFPSFDWSSAPRPSKFAYIPPTKNIRYNDAGQ